MNELQQRRVAKQYMDYYKSYNQGFRQLDDKKPESTHKGLVSWVEPGVDNPLRTMKILVGAEQI